MLYSWQLFRSAQHPKIPPIWLLTHLWVALCSKVMLISLFTLFLGHPVDISILIIIILIILEFRNDRDEETRETLMKIRNKAFGSWETTETMKYDQFLTFYMYTFLNGNRDFRRMKDEGWRVVGFWFMTDEQIDICFWLYSCFSKWYIYKMDLLLSHACIWMWLWDILVIRTLRSLDPATLELLDFQNLGTLSSCTTSSYFLLLCVPLHNTHQYYNIY